MLFPALIFITASVKILTPSNYVNRWRRSQLGKKGPWFAIDPTSPSVTYTDETVFLVRAGMQVSMRVRVSVKYTKSCCIGSELFPNINQMSEYYLKINF